MHTTDRRIESAIFLNLMNETNICKICNKFCGCRGSSGLGTGLVSCHSHCFSAQTYFPIFSNFKIFFSSSWPNPPEPRGKHLSNILRPSMNHKTTVEFGVVMSVAGGAGPATCDGNIKSLKYFMISPVTRHV